MLLTLKAIAGGAPAVGGGLADTRKRNGLGAANGVVGDQQAPGAHARGSRRKGQIDVASAGYGQGGAALVIADGEVAWIGAAKSEAGESNGLRAGVGDQNGALVTSGRNVDWAEIHVHLLRGEDLGSGGSDAGKADGVGYSLDGELQGSDAQAEAGGFEDEIQCAIRADADGGGAVVAEDAEVAALAPVSATVWLTAALPPLLTLKVRLRNSSSRRSDCRS